MIPQTSLTQPTVLEVGTAWPANGPPGEGLGLTRRTIRAAAEDISRTLQAPIHIRELVRRLVEALGIEEHPSTEASVREALGRSRFMGRSGPGLYAAANVMPDGKAFRLRPTPWGRGRTLPRWRLEPFASGIENAGMLE